MFPGDKACRETVPHSKCHELSASALLDMVYLSDCVAAVVTGSDGSGCAHLSNIESSTGITRSEVSDWVNTNIVVPNIPIVKDVVPLFIEEINMQLDLNDNDKIEWIDIKTRFTLFQTLSNQSSEQSKVSFRELRTFAPPTVTGPPLTNSVAHFNLAFEKMASSPASRTVNASRIDALMPRAYARVRSRTEAHALLIRNVYRIHVPESVACKRHRQRLWKG
jgi:hypothetical protein